MTSLDPSVSVFPACLADAYSLGGPSELDPLLPNHPSNPMGYSAYYGAGDDIINLGEISNIVYAGEGINLVTTGLGNDVIYTGTDSDFINGGDGWNTIFAGEGNNHILTGQDQDLIYTGSGNDFIYSNAGDDVIFAGNGNNIINAGTGFDTVFLGEDRDKLILEGGKGSVTVIGFNAKVDQLRLGESLIGRYLTYRQKGNDTLVLSGRDLLATLKDTAGGTPNLVDSGPLHRYAVTDLGSLSSDVNGAVNAASINDFGQIAGRYNTGEVFTNTNATTGVVNRSNPVRQGFIWENGTQTALTSTGLKQGDSDFGAQNGATVTLLTPAVNTISNNGVLLGTGDEVRQPVPLATDRALIWERADDSYQLTIHDFGGKESYYFDTVDGRFIVGRNILTNGFETPIYSKNGEVMALETLGGDGGTARGLNAKGQIVGSLDSDGKLNDEFVNTAALWSKGTDGNYQLKNLGTFGAEQAALRDLNNQGSIIGVTSNGSGSTTTSNPFLLRKGQLTSLGSLGGKTGSVNGINEFDQAVGASQTAAGTSHAMVWNAGVLADLNNLVTTPITYGGAAVTLTSAVGINNFGDIAATGTYTYKDAAGNDVTGTRSYLLKAI